MLPECEKSEEKEYFSISVRSVVFVLAQNDVDPTENDDDNDAPSPAADSVLDTGPSLKDADTLA